MFGKLLKHDFIATGRIMVVIYAIFAALTAYILGSFYLGDQTVESMGITQIISIFILLIGSFVNIILSIVVIMTNFQKSLYGDQGYLTFTLPVKTFSILTSKLLVLTFWYVMAAVAFFGSFFIVFDVLNQSMGEEGVSVINMLLGLYDTELNLSVVVFLVIAILVNFFFSALLYIVEVCFSITLSNTRHFQKHHVLFTLLFAAISIFVASKISTVISDNILLGLAYDLKTESLAIITDFSEAGVAGINMISSVVSVVFIIGFFFVTHYLMKKKINLR